MVSLEPEDVLDVRSAEGIDRLIIVADDEQVAVLVRQQLQPAVLGAVRVLVLVDQHVAEGAPVAVADLLEQLEEVHAAEQEVVEVHRVRGVDALLVQVVHVGGRLLEEGRDLQPVRLGVEQRFLRVEIWRRMPRGAKRFGSTSSSSTHAFTSRSESCSS